MNGSGYIGKSIEFCNDHNRTHQANFVQMDVIFPICVHGAEQRKPACARLTTGANNNNKILDRLSKITPH